MSDEAANAILSEIRQLAAEQRHLRAEVDDLKTELVMARRGSGTPYYSTAELMRLARKRTPKALYNWANRKGLRAHGHNQWPKREANQVLGLN